MEATLAWGHFNIRGISRSMAGARIKFSVRGPSKQSVSHKLRRPSKTQGTYQRWLREVAERNDFK
eukprot:1826515-Amphidinium_carterae.1